VSVSEHHGVPDGYLPAPLLLAAAMLARTSTTVISVSALLALFNDPIRLAEDIAVLDNVAPGRLAITVGLGYRDEEYAMFGVDRGTRGKLLDQHLRVMLAAWTGETFEHHGATVQVTPMPATRPHPLLFVGGSSRAAARRAIRFGLPFLPDRHDPALDDYYREECARVGASPEILMPGGEPCYIHIAEDPERTRAMIAKNILHDAQSYAAWQQRDSGSIVLEPLRSVDDVATSRVYRVLTPDQVVDRAKATGVLMFHPLISGLSPELGWESLRLFAEKVAPRLDA
jgi:alkanesulfonate monooxygenase SsuD/methylene tetrahydromethanopterin reductase-like flavin-dependent oxidoreductase (luciferase family)